MTSTKTHCDCCNKDYAKSYYKKHLLSKKHLKNQAASGIVQPIVVQPPQDVSNKKHCECCNKHYAKNYFKRHLKSKKHLKNQIKHEREQVEEGSIEIPKDLMKIIVSYKEDLEKYADIDNFFDRVEGCLKRCGERLSFTYKLNDIMEYGELFEMLNKEFCEEKSQISYLESGDFYPDDPEYKAEVSQISFYYYKPDDKYYITLLE